MKIALIDSGVNSLVLKKFRNSIIHVNTDLYVQDPKDNIGHGTAIAYILLSRLSQIEIVSFKLFDQEYNTTEEELICTLECIYRDFPDVDLIHISSGITYIYQYERFYKICYKLSHRKQFIISAYDNDGSISYPAAFDNVLGVYWDKRVRNVNEYFYIMNSAVEILGYAGNQRVPWNNDEYRLVSGSSFSAPYITIRIARYKISHKNISFAEIKEMLLKDAKRIFKLPSVSNIDDQIENKKQIQRIHKAIIFPINKETISLISNEDLLGFDIVGVYDSWYSRYINKNAREVFFGECVKNIIIKAFSDISWESEFDTIIVGHLELIESITKLDYKKKILEKCYQFKKNCFFLDALNQNEYSLLKKLIDKNGNCIMSHIVYHTKIANFPCGSYHKIPSPTLAIVGTSPRQGKLNIQLSLRRRFLMDGYNIGQVGTEPTSQLYGMDIAFSNGYDNWYHMFWKDEILYLNESIFRIGLKDIIILGTQSNIIPRQYGNIGFLTQYQQNALIAIEPDCCILCVNYDDEIEYISRTISVLENYYCTKVIAIIVFPFYRKLEWNINNIVENRISKENEILVKKKFKEVFKKKIFINGEKEDMDSLYNVCVHFFQEDGSR